jgi:hypothetical protein
LERSGELWFRDQPPLLAPDPPRKERLSQAGHEPLLADGALERSQPHDGGATVSRWVASYSLVNGANLSYAST